jgi:hypothetical protein
MAFDLEELLILGMLVLHLLLFTVLWNDKIYIMILKFTL